MSKYSKLSTEELEKIIKQRGIYVEPSKVLSFTESAKFRHISTEKDRLINLLVQRDNLESPIQANRYSKWALLISAVSLLVAVTSAYLSTNG